MTKHCHRKFQDTHLTASYTATTMRKREQLLQEFPVGTFTALEASEALRQCGGDIEKAKQSLEKRRQNNKENGDAAGVMPQAAVAAAAPRLQEDKGKQKAPTEMGKKEATKSSKNNSKNNNINENNSNNINKNSNKNSSNNNSSTMQPRRPPNHAVRINNLSDRQYCCVWWVEVYEDGYRPDIARSLLARVARHVNPILRDRGWRVKRLMESSSTKFLGCCLSNGRGDADAASANIQLNVRQQPSKQCRHFRSFAQLLSVMLHEITHISIGLEDIHPPAFWELMQEIKGEYATKLAAGEVDAETEEYGCKSSNKAADNNAPLGHTNNGAASTTQAEDDANANEAAATLDTLQDGQSCGAGKGRYRRRRPGGSGENGAKRTAVKALGIQAAEQSQKRRPLLKGSKLVDKRTKAGKASMETLKEWTPRELAARAAMERLVGGGGAAAAAATAAGENKDNHHAKAGAGTIGMVELLEDSDSTSDNEVEEIVDHQLTCACRACRWDKMLCREIVSSLRDWS